MEKTIVKINMLCADLRSVAQVAGIPGKLSWILLTFAFFMVSAQLGAQTTFPTVYVSTGAGQQILAINGNTGAVTGVCNISPAVPEDVVIGPDGNLYVADTTGNRIFRVPTPIPAPVSPAASCGATAIYDQSTATCTGTCPTGPEGPSFLRISTLDLYFNTHGTNTGVWKIPNIAAPASCTPSCPAPVQVIQAFSSLETAPPSSPSGEGIEFDISGNLLAVDLANNQVLLGIAPGFTCPGPPLTANCAAPFITTKLSSPFGIALNTCGDVLVASGKNVNRYGGTNSSTPGAFLDSLRFTGNNLPKFLEVDSANRLYVVTASDESGTGGAVFRFDPPSGSQLTSFPWAANTCALGSFTQGFGVNLKSGIVTGVTSANALGLGLSSSSVALTASFPAGQGPVTNLYNFGAQHTFSVTCNNVATAFDLTVTALKSRPTDAANPEVIFDPGTNWPIPTTTQCPAPIVQPECIHYGSQHGHCTQYLETSASDPNTACSSSFIFETGFFTAEFISAPGTAHSSGTSPTDTFTDCQSQDFYTAAGPGLDGGGRGTGSNSKHVMFNSGLTFPGTITLSSPISSCTIKKGVVTCNPQFNIGQTINVKFTLLDPTLTPITNATEQLSILLVQYTVPNQQPVTGLMIPQTVVPVKSASCTNHLNFFCPNGSGLYTYNDDSGALTLPISQIPRKTTAVYQFTIWGNGAPPFSFLVTGTF